MNKLDDLRKTLKLYEAELAKFPHSTMVKKIATRGMKNCLAKIKKLEEKNNE